MHKMRYKIKLMKRFIMKTVKQNRLVWNFDSYNVLCMAAKVSRISQILSLLEDTWRIHTKRLFVRFVLMAEQYLFESKEFII